MPKSDSIPKPIARLAAINAAGRQSGLSAVQREVIADLAAHPASTYPDLAARLAANPQTLRRHMADLRKSGYVEGDIKRFASHTRFSLTPQGTALVEKIAAAG